MKEEERMFSHQTFHFLEMLMFSSRLADTNESIRFEPGSPIPSKPQTRRQKRFLRSKAEVHRDPYLPFHHSIPSASKSQITPQQQSTRQSRSYNRFIDGKPASVSFSNQKQKPDRTKDLRLWRRFLRDFSQAIVPNL